MKKMMKRVDGRFVYVNVNEREDVLKIVNDVFDDMKEKDNEISKLRKQIDEPIDIKLKEAKATIERLNNELNNSRRNSLYVLSDSERTKSYEWWQEHSKVCPGKGKYMEWVVFNTGIGSCLEYKCKHCGESIDLTDTDKW